MTFATYGRDQVCYARERIRPVIVALVERAQSCGDLRKDVEATDVKLIIFMLASVAEYAATVRPDIWRRYLALLLDGLRPARESASELPVRAPDVLDIEGVMRAQAHRATPRR
jgi:hypothetical protein